MGAELIFVGAFIYLCLMFTMKLFSKKVKIFAKIVGFVESLEKKKKRKSSFDDVYDPAKSMLLDNVFHKDR